MDQNETELLEAGEQIVERAKTLSKQPTKEEALLLYVAILTDTNSFKFNTTAHTHRIVSELLDFGNDIPILILRECLHGLSADVALASCAKY